MSLNLGWIDKTMVSAEGDKIGKVVDTHVDANSGEPDWLVVNAGGRFGGAKKRFVPIKAATQRGDDVVVPFGKDLVKNAPEVEGLGVLTEEDARSLLSYYGISAEP